MHVVQALKHLLQPTFANDKWFDLMEIPPDKTYDIDWANSVYDEDLEIVHRNIEAILQDRKPSSFQFRAKRMWNAGDGVLRPSWLDDSVTIISDEEGNPKALMACLTDISHLKYSESEQRLRWEEALEAKRQQEKYVLHTRLDLSKHHITLQATGTVHPLHHCSRVQQPCS